VKANRLLWALCLVMPYVFNLTVPAFCALAGWTFWQQRAGLRAVLAAQALYPLWLLLGLTLVSTPWMPDPLRHLYGWIVQLLYFVGLYLLLRLRSESLGLRPEQLIGALLTGAAGICLLGWVQYLNFGLMIRSLALPPSEGLWGFYLVDWVMIPVQHAHARVYSLFYAPPMLGVYLAILLPLGLYQLQRARTRLSQLAAGLLLFLLLSVLVLSFTRIAWLAAGLACVVWLAKQGSRRTWSGFFGALLALVGLSLVWPAIWQHGWERLLSMVSLEHYSNAGRLEIWQRSWSVFTSRWLGSGLLSFWTMLPDFRWRWPHAHSLLLQQLLELGLLATLCWYLWLAGLLRRLPQHSDLAWACACSLLAYLVCGWADYPGYEPRNQFLFWALAALASAPEQAQGKRL
jgi:hypothetical protein